MAVRADHEVAGNDQPLVREQDVLDPHPADLEVVHDAELLRELAHHLDLFGALDVLVRREVVGHEGDPLAVEHRRGPQRPERLDRDRAGDVVAEGEIDLRQDQLPARPPSSRRA